MKFETKIEINRKPEDVFRYMVSPSKLTTWSTFLQNVRSVSGRRSKIGGVSELIFKDEKGVFKVKEEVLDVERGKLFVVMLSEKNLVSTVRYILEPKEQKTVLTTKVHTKLIPAFLGIFGFFMKGALRNRLKQDLQSLKKGLEKNG